jgi:hypothetical protein
VKAGEDYNDGDKLLAWAHLGSFDCSVVERDGADYTSALGKLVELLKIARRATLEAGGRPP